MTFTYVYVLVLLLVFVLLIKPVQTISCYTCNDCDQPYNSTSPNISQSLPSCHYCYKLAVTMAFIPTSYVVKECVATCTPFIGGWGGSSMEVSCCTSSLCNNALDVYFQYTWKNHVLLTMIPSLVTVFYSISLKT